MPARHIMRLFGQITDLNSSRGFGFITCENGTRNHFFHMSGFRAFRSLRLYDRCQLRAGVRCQGAESGRHRGGNIALRAWLLSSCYVGTPPCPAIRVLSFWPR